VRSGTNEKKARRTHRGGHWLTVNNGYLNWPSNCGATYQTNLQSTRYLFFIMYQKAAAHGAPSMLLCYAPASHAIYKVDASAPPAIHCHSNAPPGQHDAMGTKKHHHNANNTTKALLQHTLW
jgi:hypothetical protein